MTIHGSGYRPLEYEPTSVWSRTWPIAVMEFKALFRSRWGVLVFLVCQSPAIGSLVLLLAMMGVWQIGGEERALDRAAAMTPRANPGAIEFYIEPVMRESLVVFLVLTFLVTCRAIAKDRVANALEIYWTRGITPLHYFVGKWFGSFMLLGVGFIAAPTLLWCLAAVMTPDEEFFGTTIAFMPRVVLALVAFTAVMSGLATGFSALARSPNLAAILWVFLMVGTTAVGRALARVFRGEHWLRAINPWDAMTRIVQWIVDVNPRVDYPVTVALASIGVVTFGLGVALRRRLSLEDAVG